METLCSEQPQKSTQPVLSVHGLKKYFPVKKGFWGKTAGYVKAVDDISFQIHRGKTYSLVGESGCGKTTTGRCILRLITPSAGEIKFNGEDTSRNSTEEMRLMRSKMQIIFQDPYSSLNPRQSIGSAITEGMKIHGILKPQEREERMQELLQTVGLPPEYASRYPHEFSGGQRQRICIARALAVSPEFIVCDEAVSALDVSIQAQVINLLQHLQKERNLSYLFISHDLAVVRHLSDRLGVMYLGQLMEEADTDELYGNPLHPYTQSLLSAVPQVNQKNAQNRIMLSGEIPSPLNPPQGCPFHTRCPKCSAECKTGIIPETQPVKGHRVKCLLYC